MKVIASIKKSDNVRFISHLDVQRMLQRTVRRANIPVAYSQGFNPHPLISFATALAVGQTGECEWIEIRLKQDMPIDEFVKRMNENFPKGFELTSAKVANEGTPSLSTLMVWSQYIARTDTKINEELLKDTISNMLEGEITVTKHKKQGGRKLVDAQVDIRPMVYDFYVQSCDDSGTELYIRGRQDASGSLNADLLLKALNEKLGMEINWLVHRKHVELKSC